MITVSVTGGCAEYPAFATVEVSTLSRRNREIVGIAAGATRVESTCISAPVRKNIHDAVLHKCHWRRQILAQGLN